MTTPTPIDQYRQSARDILNGEHVVANPDGRGGSTKIEEYDDIDNVVAALTAAAEGLVEQIIGEDAPIDKNDLDEYLRYEGDIDTTSLVALAGNNVRAEQRNALRQSQRKQVEGGDK